MRKFDPTIVQAGAAAAAACGLVACPAASAQGIRGEVEVSAGAAVVDNPYLEADNSGVTAAANIQIQPRLSYDNSVTQVDIVALAQGKAYASSYDFEDNYALSAALRHRVSERMQFRANGGFRSTASRGIDLLPGNFPIDGPALPETPVPLPIEDITTFGQRGRTSAFNFGTGVDWTIDARNRLSFDHTFQRSTFDQANTSDYNIYQGEARYTRILTEQTSVGLIAGYQISDFGDPLSPDAGSVLGLASISHRLNAAWSISASAGVNRTRIDASALQPGRFFTTLATRVGVCRRDNREALCVDLRRQPQPAASGNVRNSTLVSANYSYRLSEYDSVTLSGSYSRSSALEDLGRVIDGTTEFISVRGRFNRRISERLTAYAEAGVDRISGFDESIEPRKMIGVGVSYTFGRGR